MSLKAAWVICGIVVAGVLLGWLAGRHWGKPARPASALPQPSREPTVVWSGPRRSPLTPPATPFEQAPAWFIAQTNSSTDGNDTFPGMLGSGLEDPEEAVRVLQMFPLLPEADQVAAAEQLSLVLTDEDYPLLGQYLIDTSLSERVLGALLAGVLSRPNAIKAPLLLAVAEDGSHPQAAEARTLLEGLMGQELGPDPTFWPAIVQRWLQAARQEPP